MNSHNFEEVYSWLGIDLNKLGCVMIDIQPLDNMYSIEFKGAGVALYKSINPARFWIDGWIANKVAHLTLLYGLLASANNIRPHVDKVLEGWKLDEVEIDHIGYFDSPYPDEPYYCLIAHIKPTGALLEGHQRLEFLPHVNTFMGYKPHMTIAYINKEQGEAYRDRLIEQFNTLWAGKKLKTKNLNYGK